jgi:glycerol-3-phosphate acyltransferase PlsY
MDPILRLVIIIVQSYLIGSIPNALIIGKRFFGIDVRTVGSGNMGSTNVFRTLGWKAGAIVQLLDIAKGLVAVLLVAYFFDTEMPFNNRTPFEDETIVGVIAGVSAVIGHMWSIFAGFKGGKGINTSLGLLIAVAPVEVAVGLGIFLALLFLSGYVSLGSIGAAIVIPSTMVFRYNVLGVSIEGYDTLVFFLIGLSLLVLYAHRSNMRRLIEGTESRFSNLAILRRKSGD